ncbi:unnamed protein product [Bursaphelenchus xylophilus]|uniref:(pine wood nematode) hypothetical protein n=1 Tax=Bursaphelenchus xylophilus TaxID=6326 RepID=A0A811KMV2_BURXY|nr:unnamed protein product [Bursaphelenchus xylophilus]CAG9101612.1 unnamed protein product [Bursaphelenchus xylophilus]
MKATSFGWIVVLLWATVQSQPGAISDEKIDKVRDVLMKFKGEYLNRWNFLSRAWDHCRRVSKYEEARTKVENEIAKIKKSGDDFCRIMDLHRDFACERLQVYTCRRFTRYFLYEYTSKYLDQMQRSGINEVQQCQTFENAINQELFEHNLRVGGVYVGIYTGEVVSHEIEFLQFPERFCKNGQDVTKAAIDRYESE